MKGVTEEPALTEKIPAEKPNYIVESPISKAVKAYTDLITLPKEILPDVDLKALTDSYRVFEANETLETTNAFMNKVHESIKIASENSKSITLDEGTAKTILKLEGIRDEIKGYIDSQKVIGDNGVQGATRIPYSKGKPSFRKGVDLKTWESAKGSDGFVRDPHTKEVINWEPGQSRKGVWDMGHVEDQKYSDVYKEYIKGLMTVKEFRDWYNDYKYYRPEKPSPNRSHRYEKKNDTRY